MTESRKKRIVVLGSTGSIGENTLRIVEKLEDRFEIVGLAAQQNVDRILEQARDFQVSTIAVADPHAAARCVDQAGSETRVLSGESGVEELAAMPDVDIVVAAIVGMAGLRPTLAAISEGTDVALATKEVLVSAGHVVMRACEKHGAQLLPVDSEPSALFQCLAGKDITRVKRMILTASGGPFAGRDDVDFDTVSVSEALNHPNWDMGKKVTIDSATLMNKGLETMEVCWLFGVPVEAVDVIIHKQSIIHSMVEFVDGNILAQMSLPDMRFAIQYALTYPNRADGELPPLPFADLGALHFCAPDVDRFPCLGLARHAAFVGGSMPAVLNAANEVAVDRFINQKISFADIWRIVERVMNEHNPDQSPDLDAVVEADVWARRKAEE